MLRFFLQTIKRKARLLASLALASTLLAFSNESFAFEMRLPAECTLGSDCFIQQFPDMQPGPEAKDPFCSTATYDGHDGTDLRVLSMADVARGVYVVAVADGQVLRTRGGEQDHLVMTSADRAAVNNRECGNGVVMQHTDGFSTQYCHLKQGSIVVRPGDILKAGDRIGQVGASGLAAFPHVHLSVRKDGKTIDPWSGRRIGEACQPGMPGVASLFAPTVRNLIVPDRPAILSAGLSGAVPQYDRLVFDGPPQQGKNGDPITSLWSWVINMKAGDTIRFHLRAPDGTLLIENTSEPLTGNKAVYLAYTGKRQKITPGRYDIHIGILRTDAIVAEKSMQVDIR